MGGMVFDAPFAALRNATTHAVCSETQYATQQKMYHATYHATPKAAFNAARDAIASTQERLNKCRNG